MLTRSEARHQRQTRPDRPKRTSKAEVAIPVGEKKNLPEFAVVTPNDPINEQILLAAELVDKETRSRLVKLFKPDHFYADQHRLIHAGVTELERLGLEYDPSVLMRIAPDIDLRILETLVAARPDLPRNLEFHVETLQWDSRRAQVAQGPLSSFLEAFQNPKEEPERVKHWARQLSEAFAGELGSTRFLRDKKEVVRQAMETLRKRTAGDAYYPFGIKGLDYAEDGFTRRLRPGLAPGLMTVLTGASGAGKTTMACHLILGQVRQKRRVLVGAWEVRAPMTLELLATLSLGWSRSRMLDGKSNTLRTEDGDYEPLTDEELDEIEAEMHHISEFVTFVDNPFKRGSIRTAGKVSNDDYIDILEEHIKAAGCEVVLLDLFDRCLRHRRPDDEQEALWRMLEMTEAQQVHMVLVHQQLIKGEDVRKDRKPSLAGLKGSSAYVDAAATIIAPHMPALFKNVPNNTFEVYGLKQRFSPPFGVEFDWEPDTGQLSGGRDVSIDDASDSITESSEVFGKPKRRWSGKKK